VIVAEAVVVDLVAIIETIVVIVQAIIEIVGVTSFEEILFIVELIVFEFKAGPAD
jgi:uncharacterized membrane protein